MIEYRTMPLNRQLLLDEVNYVSYELKRSGSAEVLVSFGCDCNLSIDEMWKEESVAVSEIMAYVLRAEQRGIVVIGKGDIFVQSRDFCLTLCHEGDAHIEGIADLVPVVLERWVRLEYQPYGFEQQL